MKCIYCSHKKTEVVNSRETAKGIQTWRRRKCIKCEHIFTTTESALAYNAFVIKRNGRRERLVYEKLFVSLFTVIHISKYKDNGQSAKLAKSLSQKILQNIVFHTQGTREIRTQDIIVLAHSYLQKINRHYADHYIHYSRYREEIGKKHNLI
jgi:transcriptional repressor NrdR